MAGGHCERSATGRLVRVAVVLALAIGLGACDLNVTVSGVVRDPSGAPLEDVDVTLQTPGREPDRTKTINDGSYNVGIVGADPKQTRISFQKLGFREQAQQLGDDPRPTIEVTLVPN